MQKFFNNFIKIIFTILLSIIFIGAITANIYKLVPASYLITIICILLICTIAIICIYNKYKKIDIVHILYTMMLVYSFIFCGLMLVCSNFTPLWDVKTIMYFQPSDLSTYLSYNYNNTLLAGLLILIKNVVYTFHLPTAVYIRVCQIIFAALAIISVIMIKQVGKKMFNSTKIGEICSIVLFGFTIFQPIFLVTYTDQLSVFLVVLIMYLLLKKDTVSLIIAGIVTGTLYVTRPSAIIFIIAIIIILIIQKNFNSLKNIAIKMIVPCIISIFLVNTILITFLSSQNLVINKQLNIPMTHYLSVGSYASADSRSANHGTWNQEDYDISYRDVDKKEIMQQNINTFTNRLKERGFLGSIKFYVYKFFDCTDTGVMFYHRDGLWMEGQPSEYKITNILYEIFDQKGKYRPHFNAFVQIIYIMLLILIAIGICNNSTNNLFLQLTMIGSWLFLIIFESGGTKYMVQYVPFISLLVGSGFQYLHKLINTKRKASDK